MYAWEYTLLEPVNYWANVPVKWKPHVTFYNVPVSNELNHTDSPLALIKRIGRMTLTCTLSMSHCSIVYTLRSIVYTELEILSHTVYIYTDYS